MSTHLRLPPRRSEAIQILEEIARDPKSATARIQAIRLLEEMRQAEQPPGTFEDLDEVSQRRVHGSPRDPTLVRAIVRGGLWKSMVTLAYPPPVWRGRRALAGKSAPAC